MRIALIYPPPWKISAPGESPASANDGPPPAYRPGDLDGDFHQIPYGMLSLAAQAIRAGHQVKVMNLSAYPWEEVETVVRSLEADLYGMSCWTANRRGLALTAKCIRQHHPSSHILVGGPHASPLAREMLEHYPAIDTVTEGESEQTFLELLERLANGQSNQGLPGAYFRVDGRVERGPKRGVMDELDRLSSVHEHFDTHIVMTSRGCPWACTFCGAESQWGRGFRANSVNYVLDAIERLLERLPVKMILIKDDTFTTNRNRVIELCRGIRERNLQFLWSCDTRVDLLSEELLREMRLAGCQRLSLGVESGAPDILKEVDKKITVDDIIASTQLAKRYGFVVRYFMMLGNRGETEETFGQTLEFLERAQPHEYIFSCLSIYPGTRDFADAEQQGWLDREVFFTDPFQELKIPFDADEELTAKMNAWFQDHSGRQRLYQADVEACQTTIALLGEHHAAYVDLAGAYYRENQFDEAEKQIRHAMELDYPLPGLALNYLACIAAERGDFDSMMDYFDQAAKSDPQHYVLIQNVNLARAWFKNNGPSKGLPLNLIANHEFQLLERTTQPVLPGPLADDFHAWPAVEAASVADPSSKQATLAPVGSSMPLESRKKLKVIS